MANTDVRWDIWRHIPYVEVWKAVALSIGIDPDNVKVSSSGDWKNKRLVFEDSSREFKDRLRIATSNLLATDNLDEGLPKEMPSAPADQKCSVSLAKFAAWAANIGWDLPNELQSLIRKQDSIAHWRGLADTTLKRVAERDARVAHLEAQVERSQGWHFDPDSPMYPPELAVAVLAWRAVAQDFDPKKKPKAQIERWISIHYPRKQPPHLSKVAIERIATVCNWEKGGGPPRSQ